MSLFCKLLCDSDEKIVADAFSVFLLIFLPSRIYKRHVFATKSANFLYFFWSATKY